MINFLLLFFLSTLLFLLPGCTNIINWGKREVPQIKKVCFDLERVSQYIQTILVYQKFTLIWNCDILYFSRDVLEEFVAIHANRVSLLPEEREQLYNAELEHYEKNISFIFLLPYQIQFDKKSEWRVILLLNDLFSKPIVIEQINIAPEYKLFFGPKYNRLKYAYKVIFEKPPFFKENMLIKLRFKNACGEFTAVFPAAKGDLDDNCNRC